MKTLIADDDEITRVMLSAALTRLGHDVSAVSTGREAWEAWHSGGFRFVILDWMMPGLDGLELCRRIRAEPRADYSYVVLLTSRAGSSNFLEAMNAGADDFIAKPFERDAFAARVCVAERILGLQALLREANAFLEQRVDERTADLQAALRAKGEFLSRASHELRTPMNHILGFAQLLELEALDPEKKACVGEILAGGDHLLEMIDQILQVSRPGPPGGLTRVTSDTGGGDVDFAPAATPFGFPAPDRSDRAGLPAK